MVISDGEKIVKQWESLVRPSHGITSYVQRLTGITNNMVADAPTFDEIADELYDLLIDKVFIAHNVQFDYGYIRRNFEILGRTFHTKRVCSKRFATKIMPDLERYGLSSLVTHLDIKNDARHRAMGDAYATALVFQHCVAKDKEGEFAKLLKERNGETFLPAHIAKKKFQKLPSEAGVYYMLDKKNEPIYIGKAINIKQRIYQHFTGNKITREKQVMMHEIRDIKCEVTGSYMLASILEDSEIRFHWPLLNRAQKKRSNRYGVFEYETRGGEQRLTAAKIAKQHNYIASFPSLWEAREFVQTSTPDELMIAAGEALVWDQGRHEQEVVAIHISKNEACGFGYVPLKKFNPLRVPKQLKPLKPSPTINATLRKFIAEHPENLSFL